MRSIFRNFAIKMAKALPLGNKNKILFILYSAHLFVPLQREMRISIFR